MDELFTLNTCDTINVLRLNSLAKTVYTKHLWHNQCVEVEFTCTWTVYSKHLWHDQCVEVEFTWHELFTLNTCDTMCCMNCLQKHCVTLTLVTLSICGGWIHLHELFTLNTCDTINVWRLNSLAGTIYTKHLWHNQCV